MLFNYVRDHISPFQVVNDTGEPRRHSGERRMLPTLGRDLVTETVFKPIRGGYMQQVWKAPKHCLNSRFGKN